MNALFLLVALLIIINIVKRIQRYLCSVKYHFCDFILQVLFIKTYYNNLIFLWLSFGELNLKNN